MNPANENAAILAERDALRQCLLVVLDCVDYTANACRPTDMVSAVLPRNIIENARRALEKNSARNGAPNSRPGEGGEHEGS